MYSKRSHLVMLALLLVFTTLACSIFSKGGDQETATQGPDVPTLDEPVAVEQPAEPTAQSEEQQPVENPAPDQPQPNVELGDEVRSEEGGYAFKAVPDWKVEEAFGLTSLEAPNADPELGPFIMIIGGTNEEQKTTDEIYTEFTADMDENTQVLAERNIKVGGVDAKQVDVAGTQDGQNIAGRIVVAAVTPTQQFSIVGFASSEQWKDVAPLYDALVASISFFEPQEIDFSDLDLEEELPDDSEIPEVGEITGPDQLPPEGFSFFITDNTGTFITVNNGQLQYQSTSEEIVIGLVSEDQANTVTLFLPKDVGANFMTVKPYDDTAATKAPSAAVYVGVTLYKASEGFIMIDEKVDNAITGSFYFTAQDENGTETYITGFFNQIPLE